MNFKHTGLFPEQAVNWDFSMNAIKNAGRKISVLNLFAYTGAASVACSAAGADVCHVDASKGMVAWAKENALLNGITNIRFIVDDCIKFVEREIRRGRRYDVIIMDPPSYGRGPGGEVWKLEDELYGLLTLCINARLHGGRKIRRKSRCGRNRASRRLDGAQLALRFDRYMAQRGNTKIKWR